MKSVRHVFRVEVVSPEPVDSLRAELGIRHRRTDMRLTVLDEEETPRACLACGSTGRHAAACRFSPMNQAQIVATKFPARSTRWR